MLQLPPALAGTRIFPVRAGGKLPALDYGWQTRATNDNAQLTEWDRALPNLNWGVAAGPSGLFIIDVDPNGLAAWEKLQDSVPGLRAAVARSFTVRTPRRGFHHYFRGYGPTTASAIAPGIDTRGGYVDERTGKWKSIGYVVLPGSRTVEGPKTVNGEYSFVSGEVHDICAAVLQIVPERKRGATIALDHIVAEDNPRNIQTCRDLLTKYVADGRVSIQGAGGDDLCYKVIASIMDKGISPSVAMELLEEIWNPHCSPPWDSEDLEIKIERFLKYGDETSGEKGFQTNEQAFEKFQNLANYEVPAEWQEKIEPEAKRKRFEPMWLHDARKEKREAKWLVPGFLPDRGVGILYGLSGSYKTFVALDWALSLAHGISGQWGTAPVKHVVVFLAGESRFALQQERVDAWCECHGVDPDASEFIIVPGVPAFADKEGWEDIRSGLLAMRVSPTLIAIDTLTRVQAGTKENDNDDQKLILKLMEEMSNHYGCFVLMTAHTGKDESKGIRGAQVLIDNSDAVFMAKKTSQGTSITVKKLKEVDIPEKPFQLEMKKFGKSIVLARTETVPRGVEAKAEAPKTNWSDPDEIIKRIRRDGGNVRGVVMVSGIMADFDLSQRQVSQELSKREDIQIYRTSDNIWRIPGEEDLDL